jgi:hypothetical protein
MPTLHFQVPYNTPNCVAGEYHHVNDWVQSMTLANVCLLRDDLEYYGGIVAWLTYKS